MHRKIARSVFIILLTALFLSGCPNQQPSSTSGQNPEIPASGGIASGDKKTDYTFTPDITTIWKCDIVQGGEGGITLEVFDPENNRIGHSQSALSWIYMREGITYKISMDVWTYSVGSKNSYTMTVSPVETIPGEGGEVQVDSETRYIFTPGQSGLWTFSTYADNGNGEPFIWVWDIIAEEDLGNNFGGAVYHDALTVELTAGIVYSVNAAFRAYGTGSYTLDVSPGFV